MGGIPWWETTPLAALAEQGDLEADAVVMELLNKQSLPAVQALLNTLTRNREVVPEALPDCVKHYLADVPVSAKELEQARRGEWFFSHYGPEIMMVLCCAALPFDYANARGVEVLNRTGFLSKQTNLRVAQTAQMIVDVLSPGGLGPRGHGIRSAQKVRLMHAAIRCLLLSDETTPWDRKTLGTPISQLQLLYTLMSFSQVVLLGLRRLGLNIAASDEQAYLEVWGLVGRIMGIKPELIPRTLDEAARLTVVLAAQAQAKSPAGEQLTKALSELVGEVLGPFACMRHSLIRYFTGPDLAKLLGLPHNFVLDWAVGGVAWVVQWVDGIRRESKDHQLVFRWLTLRVIQLLIDLHAGSPRRLFVIPTAVHDDWKRQSTSGAA